ncbi:MAG: PDR/VanB family oxidoreductase [Hylemonella sp.]|nr:PDR/VanB family oxidoreductase [Hylemonella sp.]
MRQVNVSRVQAIARDVLLVELRAEAGQVLPGATPGAHIDLHLPNGLVRQYSLTNARGQTSQDCYQIAIGRDAHSRGGSAWVHDKLRVGSSLTISEPRNLFELDTVAHRKVLFIGAGIGITPIYAMAAAAARADIDWALVACARSASRMAFAEELQALDRQRVRFHFDLEQGGPLDLPALVKADAWDSIYACGPAGLLDAIEVQTADWPAGTVRMERFKAPEQDVSANTVFELVLSKSGRSIQVSATESPLEALERCGVEHPYACREGLCGTCEVQLVEGQAQHRDNVLDAQDKAAGHRFIPCVSRCGGDRLVINL